MNLGPQFEQLPMFMTAKEITRKYNALNGDRFENADFTDVESNEEVWDRKADEAADYLARDIETSGGVRQPVPLSTIPVHSASDADEDQPRPQLLNGHHRVGYMLYHRPDDLMPVTHHDSTQVQNNNGHNRMMTADGLPVMAPGAVIRDRWGRVVR